MSRCSLRLGNNVIQSS